MPAHIPLGGSSEGVEVSQSVQGRRVIIACAFAPYNGLLHRWTSLLHPMQVCTHFILVSLPY